MEALFILLIDLFIGFAVQACVRKISCSILVCVIVPPVVAAIAVTPSHLFADGGEAHGWAVWGFEALTILGFAASAVGAFLGGLLRKRRRSS